MVHMSKVVGVRVSQRILALAEKMVALGLASSRNDALNKLLERGAEEIMKEITEKLKIEEKVRFYEEQGGIDLGPIDMLDLVRRGRDRWTT